jgi:glutathionyl-hydroquinone reductase
LKGLEGVVTLINAGRPPLTEIGWEIAKGIDTLNGFRSTKEIYLKANPEYNNRYTVPILWDQKLQTIGVVPELIILTSSEQRIK